MRVHTIRWLLALLLLISLAWASPLAAAEVIGSHSFMGHERFLLSDGRIMAMCSGCAGPLTVSLVTTCPFPLPPGDGPYQFAFDTSGPSFLIVSRTGRCYRYYAGDWVDFGNLFDLPTSTPSSTWGNIKSLLR